jgi:hypothetical protein
MSGEDLTRTQQLAQDALRRLNRELGTRLSDPGSDRPAQLLSKPQFNE